MIKQYEGNGLNKIHFISTRRELEIYDQELQEISDYTSELEDKIQNYMFELKKAHMFNEELLKINNRLQRKELK